MRSREVGACQRELAGRAREAGLRLGVGGLVGARVDGEKQLALLDDFAVLEMHPYDLTRHPGKDFHAAARFETADIVVPFDNGALHRQCDGYRGRLEGTGRQRLLAGQ
ncbi:hypothetical protein G6F57_014758 [Rhizopus arrhizus]|nr:hypothetical protein G6F57_014758 [Rhizopus arrhizus]